jgi:hypothetical protein
MQPQGLTTRLEGQDPSITNDVVGRPSRGVAAGRLALAALLVGGAVAAAGLWFDRPATTQASRQYGSGTLSFAAAHAVKPTTAGQVGPGTPNFAAAHAVKPTTTRQVGAGTPNFAAALHATKPSAAPQKVGEKPVRRSLMVLIPGDRDYVASSSIAVAGFAFGRPRSARVSAVEVELFVAGRLVDHVRLDVLSSRFAGVLKLSTPIGTTDAELRISDPTHQSGPAVVRHVTIDPPTAS